jgi:hypothetical protein
MAGIHAWKTKKKCQKRWAELGSILEFKEE